LLNIIFAKLINML